MDFSDHYCSVDGGEFLNQLRDCNNLEPVCGRMALLKKALQTLSLDLYAGITRSLSLFLFASRYWAHHLFLPCITCKNSLFFVE
jgi:hypothetical protein